MPYVWRVVNPYSADFSKVAKRSRPAPIGTGLSQTALVRFMTLAGIS